MKKRSALLGLTLTLFGAAAALATDGTPTPGVTPTVPTPTLGNLAVPKPQILESKDKISDSTNYYLPPPPRVGADGNDLALVLDRDDFPLDLSALGLDDPANLSQLPALLKADTDGNKYYWHSLPKGDLLASPGRGAGLARLGFRFFLSLGPLAGGTLLVAS